jgi:hypothetical protein
LTHGAAPVKPGRVGSVHLHARHAELAPRLAAVLKRMKSEGVLDRYLREARREVDAKAATSAGDGTGN